MDLADITPVILTYNEEPNLERALGRLGWAKEVVIIDSHSKDQTRQIAAKFNNVRWIERPFDDHTSQWNHGLDAVHTAWVLTLDSDYILGKGFEDELSSLQPGHAEAFHAAFRYLIFGKPLRACLYPPRAVLFRKDKCRYQQEGHTQMLMLPSNVGSLQTRIDHDDRKPLSRWCASQVKYADIEADHLLHAKSSELRLPDRLRQTMIAAPILVFFHLLFWKGLILDGRHGWYYVWQRVFAEILLSLHLLHKKLEHHLK